MEKGERVGGKEGRRGWENCSKEDTFIKLYIIQDGGFPILSPIFLSSRPGLSRAGSSTSGRFVAIIIFTCPSRSNPSI